jgi:RNA-directed DNA polymerase
VNTVARWPSVVDAWPRVLGIQTKLHRWAVDDGDRRFDDLFNLVTDPAVLRVAWERVRSNRGARTSGVDGITARYIEGRGEDLFLADLRADLRIGRFAPLAVRERLIPKAGGRMRRLGIPTVRDRVAQAALKLVLEPIFEADFDPCSYGFRPKRRALDAIAEIQYLGTRSYEWVLEADIEACFDMIDHTALMDRVRGRVGDRRVLRLVKAFLKSGLLTVDGASLGTITGTPQGGILSPLLANIALSTLDERFARDWKESMGTVARRHTRRRNGLGTWRLVRYADDFVVMVSGTRANAERLRAEVAAVLAPMGLRLSEAKTGVVHLDEGLDFLGFRIQRKRKRGSAKRYVYTYPSKKAVMAIKAKVRALTNRSAFPTLAALLSRVNSTLRGWAAYFRHGVSKRTFSAVGVFAWRRVVRWVRKRHNRASWARLLRHYLPGWVPTENGITLFNPVTVTVTRYRYRGNKIPNPWTATISTGHTA